MCSHKFARCARQSANARLHIKQPISRGVSILDLDIVSMNYLIKTAR
jgi:hypothetical protein